MADMAFLAEYGYLLLFVWVFIDQVGVPVPALPILLGAGALAGAGELSLPLAIATATLGAIPSDLLWYTLGRRRGASVLRFLCRVSLEPDSCVHTNKDVFQRHGALSLLYAKFVPGLQTAAPPLAGVIRMPLPRFLLLDGLGAGLWATAFIGLGWVLDEQLASATEVALELGGWIFGAAGGALGLYILYKYLQRQRVLRALHVSRITPEELKALLDAGQPVEILDLRHALDFEAEPRALPGANPISPIELEERHLEVSRDRDIVVYCT